MSCVQFTQRFFLPLCIEEARGHICIPLVSCLELVTLKELSACCAFVDGYIILNCELSGKLFAFQCTLRIIFFNFCHFLTSSSFIERN